MKNYLNKFLAFLVAFMLMQSCETEDKIIDEVFDNVERGAFLRTIEIPSATFDFYNTSSEWIVFLESQDYEMGKLLTEINVYSAFVDDGNIGDEVLIKTVSVANFTDGPFGLPRGEVSVMLQEVLDAAGLEDGDYDSSDSFNVRLESVLKDGRTFTNTNTAGTVTGGSYFSSPFLYSVQFFCALDDASMFNGNYVVVVDAWADYDPGAVVPVEFVSDYTFRILSTNNPFIDNTATSYIEVTIDPTDGSATASSNECLNYPGWACLDVIGSGSVGTCTGDINLVLDFGGYTDNAFSIVKQ